MEKIKKLVETAVNELFNEAEDAEISRPVAEFGDFATNIALKLGKKLGQNPKEIAEKIAEKLQSDESIGEATVADPGFVNIQLTDSALLDLLENTDLDIYKNQTIVAEYSDPNPFKVLHIGHLYDSIVGESIARLCERGSAKVVRVNFGGDVGLHVGKTMWGVKQELGSWEPNKLDSVSDKADWLAAAYVAGNEAYESNDDAKGQIVELNKKVYELHENNDRDSDFAKIYWTLRQWSYDYFDEFYKRIGTKFDKYYPESQTAPVGLKAVREQQKNGVFKESDGAVVFDGEVHNLHTRVFINSEGLPTYETKDIGLALCKWNDYQFDKTIIVTGSEIYEYMRVVLAALAKFEPEIAKRTKHLTHGMVKLAGGTKMSSRKGNIIRAVDVIDEANKAAKEEHGEANDDSVLGAIKYAFLKQRISGDIIYDSKESVNINGNSGPYLQYAYARAKSILNKAKKSPKKPKDLEAAERNFVQKMSEYNDIVGQAVETLAPHQICTYLFNLAHSFNSFYESNRVVGSERESERLSLVESYSKILEDGLGLLNIEAPDSM